MILGYLRRTKWSNARSLRWMAFLALSLISLCFFGSYALASNQNLINIIGADDSSSVVVNATEVDASGNTYMTGSFNGKVKFDGINTVEDPNTGTSGSIFIAKYASGGTLTWVKVIGSVKGSSSYGDFGRGIAVDSSGNVYVAAQFTGDGTTGLLDVDPDPGVTKNIQGETANSQSFLLKLNSSGVFQWAVTNRGPLSTQTYDAIAINSAGTSIYWGGAFAFNSLNNKPNTVVDGTGAIFTQAAPTNTFFVTKINAATGALTWFTTNATDNSNNTVYALALDSSEDVYAVGNVYGGPTFGSKTFDNTGTANSFVWKLNSSGVTQWADQFKSTSLSNARDVITDSTGVYVTGFFQGTNDFDPGPGISNATSKGVGDVYVVKLNPSDGALLWKFTGGGTANDIGTNLNVDSSGNLYVLGTFNGTATFGSTNVTSAGNTDLFIIKLFSSNGSMQWVNTIGSAGADAAGGVGIYSNGNIKVGATIRGSADVDPSGATTLNATNNFGTNQAIALVTWNSFGQLPSAATPPDAVPVMGGTVTIDGTAKFGQTLTANLSGLTYAPATNNDQPKYQWERDGNVIPGATNASYTLVQDDVGTVITVKVTADGSHATGNVTSTGTATVAKADGPAAPAAATLTGKTTTSITLTAVAGQEYSKDNGATWQDSATFTSLTPGTEYTFVTRVKATATHGASASSAGATFATDAVPVMGGTVTIDGTAKFGQTLTANLSGLTYAPATNNDQPTYQWERDGNVIPGATNASYTLVQDDIGAVITVKVTADGSHATGNVTSTSTATVAKADGPAAPAAATLTGQTTTSLTLTAVAGQEYSKDNGATWQDSATFTSLTPGTEYTFVTRVKATATHGASAASAGATFATDAVPVMGGTVTIDGTAKFGQTLTANLSGLTYAPATNNDQPTYQWERDGNVIPGATNASYTLVQDDIGAVITVTVTADGSHATGNVTSTGTAAVAKADGPAAPAAATLTGQTTTSLTLTAVAGQEYSKDNGATWQDSATFTSLTPGTDYTFVTRVKATATHGASASSAGATFATDAVPVMGGTVTIDGTAKFGQTLTANLSGLTYAPATNNDQPTYQWERDKNVIPGATNASYMLVQDDIGAVITVKVTADGSHATGNVTSTGTATVAKADGPAAPAAATLTGKTTTSITLTAVAGQEYSKDNGATWQDSATFASLTPGTDYTFVTRVKATAMHGASAASAGATFATDVELTYSIASIQDQSANALEQGYASGTQEALTISVTNSGTGALENLSVSLSGTHVQAFDITQPLEATLNSGDPATTFTVQAKDGLEAGTYTATVTISAGNMTNVRFTVTQVVNLPNAPANPQNLTAAAGDHVVKLSWNAVTGATYYNVYMSESSNQYNDIPVATVADATYTIDNLINGQTYYFVVRAGNLGGLGGESNEGNAIPATVPEAPTVVAATAGNGSATITFTAPSSDGGTVITAYEVYDAQNNLVGTGNSSPITIAGLTNGTTYTFTVKAKNAAGVSDSSASSNAVTPRAPSNDNGGGGSTPSTPASTSSTGVDVLVNGKIEKAGTATTVEVNGQQVTTIVVDEEKLQQRLDAEGNGAVITIPVSTKSHVVVGELNGRMVKNMENQQAVVEIRTEKATYTLPALQINIDALSERFGTNLALQDIKVKIEIAETQSAMVTVVEDAANKGGFSLVVPPLDFKVNVIYGERTEEISRFNVYVKRTVAIPDGVDPNRITTGIVVETDGTVRHVPTKIVRIDGKYYAEINSLTNSTYSVVWHPLMFEDVATHWAKDAVNNMGSRMVVSGTGDNLFSPELDITRAEFAAIMVRGLGLRLESEESIFTDVKQSAWYSSAVQTAYAYGLIAGYEDGSFRPNDKITREQAMLIVAKAMKITGLKGTNTDQGANHVLDAFSDAANVSNWSLNGVADSVSAGIISGRSNDRLAPKAFITRAEVAMMMQRLLQKSDLINE